MNIDLLISKIPGFICFEEIPISINNQTIGWHSQVITQTGTLAGGTGSDKNISRRIAVAESLERICFYKLFEKDYSTFNFGKYDLAKYPTTCGFAGGFEEDKTKLRAICEAIERWTWAKWIDEKYYIEKVDVEIIKLSGLSKFFIQAFDKVDFYFLKIKHIAKHEIDLENVVFNVGIVLGYKDSGVFAGSRVSPYIGDLWDHAILESYRSLDIYSKKHMLKNSDFYLNRLIYYGENADKANFQIPKNQTKTWQIPQIKFLHKIDQNVSHEFFLYRALIKDYQSWHLGGVERFIY